MPIESQGAESVKPSVILMWDWRDQPDLKRLDAAVRNLSGGTVGVTEVHTGSDAYAVVIANPPMSPEAANARWDAMVEAGGE